MSEDRLLYAQSGGVTAVINATAAGIIETAWEKGVETIAAKNGILGVLREELYDLNSISPQEVVNLRYRPGGAFGSARYKLNDPVKQEREYHRLLDVLSAHKVKHFLYNGGGDSQDTSNKVAHYALENGVKLNCIGVPKTVDNDLELTDCCPGFGSAAKYIANSVREATLDVASMCETSTKVFILEVMGRHAGWMAAAGGIGQSEAQSAPHIILFPERAFNQVKFLEKVSAVVEEVGYCVVVASEGVVDEAGNFLSESGSKDAFGHAQLGGLAPFLADLIRRELALKPHWAVADYLQRSARHIASGTDLDQAYSVGVEAVKLALSGKSGLMPAIVRTSDDPYKWEINAVPLAEVANKEKKVPDAYISADGWGITAAARKYLAPLIEGEAPVKYTDGMLAIDALNLKLLPQSLPPWGE